MRIFQFQGRISRCVRIVEEEMWVWDTTLLQEATDS